MNISDIFRLIYEGEGERVEFKEAFPDRSPDKIAEAVAAFANTHGGTLLFGVNDDGALVGIDNADDTMKRIASVAQQKCQPAIHVSISNHVIDGKSLVVVRVPQSENRVLAQ